MSGDNYYRVRSIGQNGSVNISPIVKVAVGKLVPSIVIYPNPVVNGIISLQMNNLEKGNYIAKLFNQAGQLIQISTIQHPGGNASASIQPDHLLASGMYQLEITAPDKVASVYQVEVK